MLYKNIILSLFVILNCLIAESTQHRKFDNRFDSIDSDKLTGFFNPKSEVYPHVHLQHEDHFQHGDHFHHGDHFEPAVPMRNKGPLPTYAETLKYYRMRNLLRYVLRNWLGKMNGFYLTRYLEELRESLKNNKRLQQKLRELKFNKDYNDFSKYDTVLRNSDDSDILDKIVFDLYEKSQAGITYGKAQTVHVSEIPTTTATTTTTNVTPAATTTGSQIETTTVKEETMPRLIFTKTRVGFNQNNRKWAKFFNKFEQDDTHVGGRVFPSKLENFLNKLNVNKN